MSNFHQLTKHPRTGVMEMAEWLDDYFGHHRYGIRFSDKRVYHEKEIEAIEIHGIGAEANGQVTTVEHWDGAKE